MARNNVCQEFAKKNQEVIKKDNEVRNCQRKMLSQEVAKKENVQTNIKERINLQRRATNLL